MTLDECTDLLTPIALALRAPMDLPTYMAYHAMLKDVPVELAAMGLEGLRERGELEFFPSAPKIQSAAERIRRQQIALNPWTPCAECEDHPRFREMEIDGVKRMQPCPCLTRHREYLAMRGLLEPIAVLPGESGASDEQIYPRFEQLPAKLQKQIHKVAGQKVLR
jgi:hypothetical protein